MLPPRAMLPPQAMLHETDSSRNRYSASGPSLTATPPPVTVGNLQPNEKKQADEADEDKLQKKQRENLQKQQQDKLQTKHDTLQTKVQVQPLASSLVEIHGGPFPLRPSVVHLRAWWPVHLQAQADVRLLPQAKQG